MRRYTCIVLMAAVGCLATTGCTYQFTIPEPASVTGQLGLLDSHIDVQLPRLRMAVGLHRASWNLALDALNLPEIPDTVVD